MIVSADTEFTADMGLAKEIAETLNAHYSGHLWAVTIQGGAAIIKALNISSLWGYLLKLSQIQHDAGARQKAVMRAGGEILERAKAERKRREDGWTPTTLEGAKKYSPVVRR